MRSSSYRSLTLGSCALVTTLFGLYACSSSSDSSPTTTLPDGAIVDKDGQTITDPDAIAASDAQDASSSLVNVTTNTVTVAGDSRTYVLSVPKSYDASKSYPLIIALAGDGQTADAFRTFLDLDAISGNDAITAYPDGVDDLFTDYADNGDQQLVDATIADVKSKYANIDASKIWGFGYSKGGYMLNQLQCLRPGTFTAFAAHATGGPADINGNLPPCGAESTTAILETKGDQDLSPDPGSDEAADYWAQQNGCSSTKTAITPSGCVKYDNCPAGKQVQYCLAAGVSHFPIWNQATAVSWAFYKSL